MRGNVFCTITGLNCILLGFVKHTPLVDTAYFDISDSDADTDTNEQSESEKEFDGDVNIPTGLPVVDDEADIEVCTYLRNTSNNNFSEKLSLQTKEYPSTAKLDKETTTTTTKDKNTFQCGWRSIWISKSCC